MVIEKEAKKMPTKSILLVGIDPSQAVLRMWKSIKDGKELGAKIIVIDPRRTHTAELADIWLQLRPGTDTALLMSMVNVIIEEELYDREFVEKWCYGFDKLTERAGEYPPDRAAGITGVPAESIREAAKMLATNRPGLMVNGMGVEHLTNSIQAIHARCILSAILGNIDVEGGEYIPGPARCISDEELGCNDALSPEQKRKQLGADRFKLLSWPGRDLMATYVKKVWAKPWVGMQGSAFAHAPTIYRAILTGKPYPVKALLTNSSNPMVTQANVKLVYKALKSLEFYVVMDYWMTPSAELADYVLPAASWLERPLLFTTKGTDNIMLGGEQGLPSAIPGEYDRKTDYEFYRGLGIRLGQDWPWENEEETIDYQLKPTGMTFKEFMARGGYENPPGVYKKYERMGFGTPTGKVELYSTVFERLGYDPLPHYEESCENPHTRPQLAEKYPLMLITGGRFMPMYHSEHRQIDSVRKRHPHPLLQMNPETAGKLGIKNGDWVWVESPRGRVRMKCQCFAGIDPGVVHAEHGWWFPEMPGEEPWLHGVWESNINVLTDDSPDVCNKLSGGWPLKTALCKVYKVKQY
jgi:anaerobic selenocysteine-containing dehydrogenase